MTNIIILLVLLLALLIGGFAIYRHITYKIRQASRLLFNTDSLIDGIKSQQEDFSNTPRSVSGMTSIYLPLIGKDFPEFNYEEFKNRSNNMLISALQAISEGNTASVINGSNNLIHALELEIQDNENENKTESYENITIHQTEIFKYIKSQGTCKITLQSAVGYYHTIHQDGKLIEGSKEYKDQCKYNIDIIYIQDVSLITHNESAFDIGVCPSCGAPISNLGNKICGYCGCATEVANVRVWKIDAFQKI